MPYLNNFSNVIEDEGVDYDLLFWNRFKVEESTTLKPSEIYKFNYSLSDDSNILLKLKGFFFFRKYVLKIIKLNSYDKIIVLTTLPSILIGNIIKKRFKENNKKS